jgi:8-oxo-dGTP pyrophosphatase MutT (NUDIX family)
MQPGAGSSGEHDPFHHDLRAYLPSISRESVQSCPVTIPAPAPASTVALIRPAAAGLEVFMVKRHTAVAVMAGAYVFPGGGVALADSSGDVAALCDGLGGVRDRMDGVLEDEARAFRVAAVRELYEEAGILLARNRDGKPVGERPGDIAALDRGRDALAARTPFAELMAAKRWRPALDWLTLFAHWVTPDVDPRRFDTYFFLAVEPEAQDASHCGRETSLGTWMRPADAIARGLAGEIALPPPTWTTLRQLEPFGSVDDAVAWARATPVPRIQSGSMFQGTTRIITLPGDPHTPAVPGFEPRETRFAVENGRWRPV